MTVKARVVVAVVAVALVAGGVLTQATPPPQTPPVQAPPAGQQPTAASTPQEQTPSPAPAPFPEGAKVAYVFMQGIFNGSTDGKAAAAKLQDWEKKKAAEIQAKMKEGEAIQAKLNQGSTLLNEAARSQAQRDLQRLQREIQAMQDDAQLEGQQLREQLLGDFSGKVNPIIAGLAKERGLHMVFSVSDGANVAWADPGLDLTQAVIERVDVASGQKK